MPAVDPLARSALFEGLTPEGLAAVAAAARPITLRRSDVLFREAESADELFVIRSGRMAMLRRAGAGHESVVAVLAADEVFGEMGLFDGGGRSTEARALERSELVAVPYGVLRQALDAAPAALWALLAMLAGRLRTTDESLADSMFLDINARTAKRLLELAGDDGAFGPPVTQDELASMVGASRERVNKAIAAFIRHGWVEQVDRRYRVIDRESLAVEAQLPPFS